jgi:hypothetical protein
LYRYMHRMIATSIAGRGKGTERATAIDLFFFWCLLSDTHTLHLTRGLPDYFAGYYRMQERRALVGDNIMSHIALVPGYAHSMSQLPLAPVPLRTANHSTMVGMRIVRRIPDGMWRLVSSYSMLGPWVPEPLVDPERLAAGEI